MKKESENVTERVKNIFKANRLRGFTCGEIERYFFRGQNKKKAIANAISRLVKKDYIVRVERGLYTMQGGKI